MSNLADPTRTQAVISALRARMALLQDVSAALLSARSVADIGAVITERGLVALGAYAGSIALLQDDGATCAVIAAAGYSSETIEAFQRLPLDQRLPLTDAIRTARPVWIRDREAWTAAYPELAAAFAAGPTHALVALPLQADATPIGAIGLSFVSPQAFSADDQSFLLAFARQVAQVLAHAQLREEERELRRTLELRVRQQMAVARLASLALASTDLDASLQMAAEVIAATLDAPLCKILELLPNGAGLLLRRGVGWRSGLVGQHVIGAASSSQASYTLRAGVPVILADLATEARFSNPPLLMEHHVVSGMSVIIGGEADPFGVLGVYTTAPRRFTEDDVTFLQASATILATAIQRLRTDAERARLLRQVGSEHRLLVEVIRQMPAGVIIVEAPSGRVVLENARMAQIWRQPLLPATTIDAYLQGQELFASGQPVAADTWPIARSLREGEVVVAEELLLQRADGSTGTIEVSSAPVRDGDGQIVAGVVVFVDVTERKTRETEHLALERRLQDTQRLESLGVLAGGIAHDFNNLLTIMLGNANLALMELPPESPARESIEQIERAGQRAADLTRQMLAYAGKGRFVVLPLNLNTLIEEIDHLLRASISKRAVLRYNLSRELPAVEADATQIRQVVMNLVVNGSEAIGERSGVITLSTSAQWADRAYLDETHLGGELPEGLYVALEVSDTGAGMDAATQKRIFEPFFTTKFTGRGLGLAAVQGIMRRHHGSLRVYSEAGHGSTFKLIFPAAGTSPAAASGAATSGTAWRGEGTVLVVDDDPDVRGLLRRMLDKMGFTVLEAPDGRSGVEVFRAAADSIVAVLLDMTMPHMSGEEAFRALRRIRPSVPVILMSGYTEEDIVGRFAGKGLAGFLHKPFAPASVQAKLQAILAQRPGEGAGAL